MLATTSSPWTRRRATVGVAAVAALFAAQLSATAASTDRGSAWTSVGHLDPGLPTVGDAVQDVIVSARGGVAAAADAVRRLGGVVETPLPMVDGVEARVPASVLPELAGMTGVTGVTADRQASFEEFDYDVEEIASGFVTSTGALAAWADGNHGAGVGVAVLDTGISEMNDFTGRLVHGPDLSGEGTLIDSYGHGTVMAGAIGGSGADSAALEDGIHVGVAPKAHLVSVKVAGRNGAVDVSTVLQGMHWISAYKDQFNIRVLNLSWGVHSTQDPAVDPLNYAVQRLWKQGIVVVVAAGNSGPGATTITKPADDPLVISVGAYNDKDNDKPEDDAQVDWTSQGPTAQGLTKPDVVAPGRSLVLARSYGSHIEETYPKALVSPSYIRGSGTSQAAAVTSGLAALLVAARPSLTPDQVKHLLRSTAAPLANETANEQGAGRVRIATALIADPGPATWQSAASSGLGSMEASRGGRNVETICPGQTTTTVITGEIDVRCEAWDPAAWTGSSWNGAAWSGSSWNGSSWNGSSWNGSSWNGSSWNGSSWNGGTWNGSSWNGAAWTGSSWNGSSWNGSSWNGSSWNGSSWNGSSWNGSSWNGDGWTGSTYDDGTFLSAWFGASPPYGEHFPGEASERSPSKLATILCRIDQRAHC